MVLTRFFTFLLACCASMWCISSVQFLCAADPSLSVSEDWTISEVDTPLKKANQIDDKLKGVDRGYVVAEPQLDVLNEQASSDPEKSCVCDYCSSDKTEHTRSDKPKTFSRQPVNKVAQGFLKTSRRVVRKARKSTHVEVGGVPIYSQNRQDPYDRKGYRGKYPQGYCGPTAMQMVLDYYGLKVSRDFLALTDLGTGPMYRKGQGSRYAPMVEMARHLGFVDTEIVFTNKLKHLKSRLNQMRPQIVSLKGYLKYSSGAISRSTKGHIVLVTGIDESGKLIIHDPAGRGSRALMNSRDFLRVWRGFLVDLRGEEFSNVKTNETVLISQGDSVKKEMVKPTSL